MYFIDEKINSQMIFMANRVKHRGSPGAEIRVSAFPTLMPQISPLYTI